MNEDALFLALELDPSCKSIYTQQDVRRRYRALAKLYHPDKNSKETHRFLIIHNAYEQLMKKKLPDTNDIFDILYTRYQILGQCWDTSDDFKADMVQLNDNWKTTKIAKTIFCKIESMISWDKNLVLDISTGHANLGKSIKVKYDCMKLYGLFFYKETKINIVMLDTNIEYKTECIVLSSEGNDVICNGEAVTGDLIVNVMVY